jgi:hypothetical protein
VSSRRKYGFGKAFLGDCGVMVGSLRVFRQQNKSYLPFGGTIRGSGLLISIQFAMQFLDLPNEIIEEIINYLEQKDIYSVIRVN